jgi:type VI secretion system protein ImpH
MQMSFADELYARGPEFDFFQAVRLLELLEHDPADADWSEVEDVARFRAHQSLNFPPSAIHAVEPPPAGRPAPTVIVNFLGMTGPQGALPTHYTQLLLRRPEPTALRDWLDLFNHRLVGLYFRAWEKYRFPVSYLRNALSRRAAAAEGPDPNRNRFTIALLSLIGMGAPDEHRRRPALWDRLRVEAPPPGDAQAPPRPLAHIDDLALLHYAGLFAHKPRNAVGLTAVIADYFGLQAQIQQFTGQWLYLDPAGQSRLPTGDAGVNCELGVNAVAGERVWDVVSKFRVRLGPLRYHEFVEFLPDPAAVPQRKGIFLLSQLARLYVGMELDFEVQLVLHGDDVPELHLRDVAEGDLGARLGWNTWMPGGRMPHAVDEAVFDSAEETVVHGS